MSSDVDDEFRRYLIESYREVIRQQFILAKYGVPFEYSDRLSFKEREVFLEILSDDIIPNMTGGQDER